jgi:hypothetical protein
MILAATSSNSPGTSSADCILQSLGDAAARGRYKGNCWPSPSHPSVGHKPEPADEGDEMRASNSGDNSEARQSLERRYQREYYKMLLRIFRLLWTFHSLFNNTFSFPTGQWPWPQPILLKPIENGPLPHSTAHPKVCSSTFTSSGSKINEILFVGLQRRPPRLSSQGGAGPFWRIPTSNRRGVRK